MSDEENNVISALALSASTETATINAPAEHVDITAIFELAAVARHAASGDRNRRETPLFAAGIGRRALAEKEAK